VDEGLPPPGAAYISGMVGDLLGSEPIRPLMRAEYDQLVEAGAFDEEHLELIEGRLVLMSPEGPRHADVVSVVTELLVLALRGRARIRPGNPLAVSDRSEPEPDVAVVALGDHSRSHPTTGFLAVEVSLSSLRKDRLIKPTLYATADVQEYWIVDLAADTVPVLTDPVDGFYRTVTTKVPGEEITLAAFPDVTVSVAEILGA
jgi:Uma2 family endonuclease